MPEQSGEAITELLQKAGRGDREAADAVMRILYRDLHRIATERLRGIAASATLQPTALVHECYVRLIDKRVDYENRLHFFRLAGRVMRGIVVDYTRRHFADKRGGGLARRPLDTDLPESDNDRDIRQMALVSEAMESLADRDEEAHDVVLLRYYAGLTIAQIAEAKGVPEIRVRRKWKLGTALLRDIIEQLG